MSTLHALVIDDDRAMLGFIADALATFEPGFRVSTTTTLEGADRRLAVKSPDILIVRAAAVSAEAWDGWVRERGINRGRIAAIGSGAEPHVASAHITEPVSLPNLLGIARGLVARAGEYDRASDDDVPELHVVQG